MTEEPTRTHHDWSIMRAFTREAAKNPKVLAERRAKPRPVVRVSWYQKWLRKYHTWRRKIGKRKDSRNQLN
jgi:hypothetical protein